MIAVSLLAAAIPIVSAESKEALNILIFVPVDPLSLCKILSACDLVSDLKTTRLSASVGSEPVPSRSYVFANILDPLKVCCEI